MVSISSVPMHIRVAHKIGHFANYRISSLQGPLSSNFRDGKFILTLTQWMHHFLGQLILWSRGSMRPNDGKHFSDPPHDSFSMFEFDGQS